MRELSLYIQHSLLLDVPDLDQLVLTPGDNALAVGGDRKAVHLGVMAGEGEDGVPVLDVPQLDGLIPGCCSG